MNCCKSWHFIRLTLDIHFLKKTLSMCAFGYCRWGELAAFSTTELEMVFSLILNKHMLH